MTHSNKSPMVLAIMIIAAIYVVMLVGLTRSSYFVGGAALERKAPGFELAAESRIVVMPERVCLAPETNLAEPQDCANIPRALRRIVEWRQD